MVKFSIILGIVNCILTFFSGWLAAWFGPKIRYFYLILGIFLGISSNSSLWYWVVLVISILIAFSMYNNSMKRIQEGKALSYVIETIQNSASGYFFGLVTGLIFSLVKYWLS